MKMELIRITKTKQIYYRDGIGQFRPTCHECEIDCQDNSLDPNHDECVVCDNCYQALMGYN